VLWARSLAYFAHACVMAQGYVACGNVCGFTHTPPQGVLDGPSPPLMRPGGSASPHEAAGSAGGRR